MKKIYCMIIALWGMGTTAEAQTAAAGAVDGVTVGGVKTERNGGYIAVDMTLDLKGLNVDGNRAVLLTPRIANGQDSLDLPSVGVYGRRRYYFYVRNGESMLSGPDEQSFKASEKPDEIAYHDLVPYAAWMDGATLSLHRSDYGCCHSLLAEQTEELCRHRETFFPELVYVQPQAERVKSRSLEGSAYIDFHLDKTDIDPGYRRNTVELGKIRATVDSVRNDADITITSVRFKGYASPEGSYAHNRDLAIGRTEALRKYVQGLYRFDEGIVTAEHEPEDWAGLRRDVEHSGLEHRAEILALIDSDLEPDAKERKIKATYPEEYRLLLREYYPGLRHTDYRIAYNIRSYNDPEEIARIMQEQPQKLSLNEFYLVAQQYEPGTDEFTDVFETAVRMFPSDATANLNAANAAMRRGDLDKAARYLDKAGNTPEAAYARGALALRREDYDTARRYLEEAKRLGVAQAAATLDELDNGRRK